jgi:hypothetical protein
MSTLWPRFARTWEVLEQEVRRETNEHCERLDWLQLEGGAHEHRNGDNAAAISGGMEE